MALSTKVSLFGGSSITTLGSSASSGGSGYGGSVLSGSSSSSLFSGYGYGTGLLGNSGLFGYGSISSGGAGSGGGSLVGAAAAHDAWRRGVRIPLRSVGPGSDRQLAHPFVPAPLPDTSPKSESLEVWATLSEVGVMIVKSTVVALLGVMPRLAFDVARQRVGPGDLTFTNSVIASG